MLMISYKEAILEKMLLMKKLSEKRYRKLLGRYPKGNNKFYQKSEILGEYRIQLRKGMIKPSVTIESFLQKKPTRTISGVVPVTVLTKPYPCCSNCIFCPSAVDQPKSYLSSEPGAARAKMLAFEPFRQIVVRIRALENIGHNTDKIEVIILGGTWSHYPKKYQAWFILEIFKALNAAGSIDNVEVYLNINRGENTVQRSEGSPYTLHELKKLITAEQLKNETAKHRCVGLVIETRPDLVTEIELKWLRFLGVTKVQMGVQTLDPKLLKLNKRDHTVADTRRAFKLLRLAGFKTHVHWMMNLYGSDPKKDYDDFTKLFALEDCRPDELKVYPCLLLKNTRLFEYYEEGKYRPYTKKELIELLIKCKKIVPEYCRISRLFRDIPSFEIVEGVKETNIRQIVQREMERRGLTCKCIRCREIRNFKVKSKKLKVKKLTYKTGSGIEYFLSYESEEGKIVGFLRLSLPRKSLSRKHFIKELQNSAIIREVHVYGISKQLTANSKRNDGVQHQGVGTKLVQLAEKIAEKLNYPQISVISAVGTRKYYEKLGYKLGSLYMHKSFI